jgi:site-specific DNA recombinase
MTRAAIYVRVSTKRQGKYGESLPEQIIECRAHADKQSYTVIGQPFEDMYTGEEIDRPALDALREFVQREHPQLVIAYCIDRLSRDTANQIIIEREFKRYGIRFEYATEEYDDTPTGTFSKTVRSAAAQLENQVRVVRTNRDKRAKARKGAIITGDRAPYGYIVVRNTTTRYLELHINETERVIVVMIYDWYTSDLHCTIREVRDRLEQMSIPSPMGNAHWSHNAVWRILSDEVYAGVWYYNKRESVDQTKPNMKKRKRYKLRPKKDWIAVPVPAMISPEAFAIAQEKLTTNRHRVLCRHKQDYLFAGGHLSCQCGRKYVGKVIGSSGRLAYRCTRRNTGGACTTPYFYEDELDQKIWEWMTETVTNIEQVIQALNDRQAVQEMEHAPLIRRLHDINALIAENRAAYKRWGDRYERGKMTEEEYDERTGRLNAELAGWEREQAKVEAQLRAVVVYTPEEITNIVAYCRRIGHGMAQMRRHERRETYEILNLQARLTAEDGYKIAYVTCVIAPREERLVVASVSRSS